MMDEFFLEMASSHFHPARFVLRDSGGQPIMEVEELPRGGLIRWTRFRMTLPLALVIHHRGFGERLILERRAGGLFRREWILRQEQEGGIWIFRARGLIFRQWTVLQQGFVLGTLRYRNPFMIGPQEGEMMDAHGQIKARIRWEGGLFSWKGARIRVVHEDPWFLLAPVGALIRGLLLQER